MLDDDIDEVARVLTDAQPSADVKARVMARIRLDARPRAPWQHWWVWSPVAVAIVLILAVMFRPGSRPPPDPAPPALADRTIAPASESVPAPAVRKAIPIAPAIVRQIAVTAPPMLADHESAVVPLPPLTVERLHVERVEVETVAMPDAIALKTLEMTRLELAPLTVTERLPQ